MGLVIISLVCCCQGMSLETTTEFSHHLTGVLLSGDVPGDNHIV